ncbi:hypothetical protein ACTXT7_016708 [Hymenolepis weldensis]
MVIEQLNRRELGCGANFHSKRLKCIRQMPRAKADFNAANPANCYAEVEMGVEQPPNLQTRVVFLLASKRKELDCVMGGHEATREFRSPIMRLIVNILQLS